MDSWSRSQLRSLLDQSEDIIIAVEDTGQISFVNSAAEDMLGYDPDEMVGMNAFEFIHEDDRNAVFERFTDLIENPGMTTDRLQHRMVRDDGRTIWVESIGSNQADTDLGGYVINTRNIGDIKAYQIELERQIDRLDQFAGVVSHDLRNPLNVAQGRLELASEECESEDLDSAAQALERMETLIQDMLSLARAGESVGETEAVGLADLIDACWRNVETESAQLVTETDTVIRADETRLQQLFENLFRNAIEHGGAEVTITVGDLPSGFFVADDGLGIPPEIREQVLEPGYSTSEQGTGFGLSIVRDIAAAHGWDIDVTSSDADGARFEFTGVLEG